MQKQESNKKKSPFSYVTSFSKVITAAWIIMWVESILFSQLAAWLGFGDTNAISEITRTITEIGSIICGFYFSTKCLENLAKGYEAWQLAKDQKPDDSDSNDTPIYSEEETEI